MNETFKKIWEMSGKRHGAFAKALAFSFIKSFFGGAQLGAIIIAVCTLTGSIPFNKAVLWIAVLMLICIAGNFLASYIEQISSMKMGFFMIADKRQEIADRLKNFPLGYFTNNSAGKITATLTSTLSGIETAAVMSMVGIVSGLFNAVVLFLIMMIFEWRAGLIAGIGMLVYLLVVGAEIKISGKYAPQRQKAQTNLSNAAITFFKGIKVIKAFSFKSGDVNLKNAIDDSCNENIGLTNRSMPSQFTSYAVIAIFESAIFLTSVYLYAGAGAISLEKTIILLIFSFMVFASLNQAGSMLSMIGMLDSGIEEARAIENSPVLTVKKPIEKPVSNEICLKNVSFSYGDNEVIHDVTTTFKENSLTAIIGPSGSGKTTLCQLIMRFYDINKGSITIGGADIRHMDEEELMKRISTVFQRVYLFEDTILNNIKIGKPDASYEEVRSAAKAARCDDFIMALPDGYDTVLKEGGDSLSGGEKQRISIARAILKNSPVIILDEATSALDAENENEVIAAIEELTKEKTVIMIAHRLETVKRADHIIAIKEGRIVQEGTHSQLAEEEGLYKDFISARQQAMGWKL